MKLTDRDVAQIKALLNEYIGFDQVMPVDAQLYLAGKRAGREDMRERAAKVLDDAADNPDAEWPITGFADRMVLLIRALGVDDD